MEHFENPSQVLDEMKSALKQDGKMFITFGPPGMPLTVSTLTLSSNDTVG